jgi:hypothetical protein
MIKSRKTSKPNKVRLTSTGSRFAWAKADRAKNVSYFHELTENWTPLDNRRKRLEVIEAALAAAAAEAAIAAAPPVITKSSRPAAPRKTVKPPKHLIYRTGVPIRKNRP